MWEAGEQGSEPIIDWNQHFRDNLKGELEYDLARKTLGKFLSHNIGFFVKLLTGFELESYQRIMIKGWLQKNFSLTLAGRGSSKCLDENGLVLSENGFKKIKDIEVGEKVWADSAMQVVEGKKFNPIEDGHKLNTKSRFECSGKNGHRLLVLNTDTLELEYKFIENVNIGDVVPIRYGMNQWANKIPFEGFIQNPDNKNQISPSHEKDFYNLLGVILGDGCLRGNFGNIGITTMDNEIKDLIYRSYLKYCMGKLRAVNGNSGKATDYKIFNVNFVKLLMHIGFNLEKSNKKIFPQKLLGLNKEMMSAFLRGLFDTDGYCRFKHDKKRNRNSGLIGLTSSSWDIIKNVQSILLNYGIISKIKLSHKGGPMKFSNGKIYNTNPAWTLFILNRSCIEIFDREIGFSIAYKNKILKEYLSSEFYNKYIYNLLPITEYFKKKYKDHQFRREGLRILRGKNVSLERLKEFLDFDFIDNKDKEKIKILLKNPYYFDEIVSKNDIKTRTVDIQVGTEKCYWSDGFINHNTFTATHFAYLYALLHPDHHVLMVSATFRSSRKVLENIDSWSKRKEGMLLRQTMIGDMTKRQDKYVITFQNQSTITAVPLGDSNKLRSLRCNVLIIDEGLLIPQPTIDLVLKPFLAAPSSTEVTAKQKIRRREKRLIEAGKMKTEEQVKFKATSKMIILSSASYQWESLYDTYIRYLSIIRKEGDYEQKVEKLENSAASYLVHQLSYKMVKEELLDSAIKQEIEDKSIPESVIQREYCAQFIQESEGYYSARKMQDCTIPDRMEPCIEIIGESGAEYILGIDPNVSSSPYNDHFAMCVLKIVTKPNGKKIGMVVHQHAFAGLDLKYYIQYFYYLMMKFNIVYVACDTTSGNNLDFINICNESELFKTKGYELRAIEAEFGKEHFNDISSQISKSYNKQANRIVQKQGFHSAFQRAANEYLQACIDYKNIIFASKALSIDNKLSEMEGLDIMDMNKTHPEFADSESSSLYEFIRYQDNMMDMVKKECALIEMKSSVLGNLSYDIPQQFKRSKSPTRPRRDSYSALLLCNWALKLYLESQTLPPPEEAVLGAMWIR